jgi:transposase, IS30 family
MSHYKQLAYEQRCQIEALIEIGLSQRAIARIVGTSQSTISREIRRNTGQRGYRYKQAHCMAVKRKRDAIKPYVMTPSMIAIVEFLLAKRWSPEQISFWLALFGNAFVSHERIYQHVWADKRRGGSLHLFLRRHGKKYQSRGKFKGNRGQIKNKISIDERPESVETRETVGHWEIDTVIGKDHCGVLVTIVERSTRFTLCKRVMSKRADEVAKATITLLTPFRQLVHSITADNGKEFAHHERISSALNCAFYFAHPYSSWERGCNENTNGLLRQYYPKNTNFKLVDEDELQRVLDELNERPRKVLEFNNPMDLMTQEMAALAA